MATKAKPQTHRDRTKPSAVVPPPRAGARKTAGKMKKSRTKKPAEPRFDLFAEGYVDAAIFADLPEGTDDSLSIHPACWPQILKDCARFQRENKKLLERAYEMQSSDGGYNEWHAGRDFWLSRQGYAIGFWSRDLDEVGDKLHDAANAYPGVDVLPGHAFDDDEAEYIFIE
jgi:hypothetical protein